MIVPRIGLWVIGATSVIGWSGCARPVRPVPSTDTIRVGDRAEDAKAKIAQWKWEATGIAWAYGVAEWKGSREETLKATESEAERLRRENDFNDNPAYRVGKDESSAVVFLRAKNGVVIEISKLTGRSNDGNWESGFDSVSKDGEFRHQ